MKQEQPKAVKSGKPYLTKIAWGRSWRYVDTRRKYKTRSWKIGHRWFLIVSYKRVYSE